MTKDLTHISSSPLGADDVDVGIKLLIENLSKQETPDKLKLEIWMKKTLEVLKKKNLVGRIELFFVSAEKIRALNKDYRNQDKATDVLSFSFLEGETFPGEDLVGQIFIEPIIAKNQAMEHGVSWVEEIEFLFVHALLHIFGYDHEEKADFKKMFDLQAKIMPDQKWENSVKKIYQDYFG
jgi:probable rRNA maturation factor